jgi:hypothetical protein
VIALSVGLSRRGRVVLAVACGLLVLSGVVLLFGSGRLADRLHASSGGVLIGREPAPGDPARFDELAGVVGDLVRLLGLCGLPLAVGGGYLLVRAVRRAAWLDGRRLAVRGALLTRTVELGRAAVTVDPRQLVALDPVTDSRVRLPLRRLPPFELEALANALGKDPAATQVRDRIV